MLLRTKLRAANKKEQMSENLVLNDNFKIIISLKEQFYQLIEKLKSVMMDV